MNFRKNDRIGQYVITFPHKQSQYAETYRVKDSNGKTCFLKLIDYSKLNRSQIDDEGNILEVEIAKQCHHHNLCTYIDSGTIFVAERQWVYFVLVFRSVEQPKTIRNIQT